MNTNSHANKSTPQRLLPLLQKVKTVYILWFSYYQNIPKLHRHSLGGRIDSLFVEVIESISVVSFLQKDEKLTWIRIAIRKIDTIKVLLMVLWESKSVDSKKYIALSLQIEEIGKMLGGWSGQIIKALHK
jgi:predicted RNA-binding protein YlqC (UPF0109 family)